MNDAELVNLVHTSALIGFWTLLVVGTVSTIARVAFYRAHGFRRPRLLLRDATMILGFALSFGLILAARAMDLVDLRSNLVWALLTDLPAIIAVAVYVYFELFVIERGGDEARDWPLSRPEKSDEVAEPAPDE